MADLGVIDRGRWPSALRKDRTHEMNRALVLLLMLVVGPWLVRVIAPRLRGYELTRGGVSPVVLALVTGSFALLAGYQLLAELFTGTVICFARNCQGATFELASAPEMYWSMVVGLFVTFVFTATLASASVLQWQDQRR